VAFLGWDIPAVHRTVDEAARYLGGRHRVVGHDLRALQAIELLYGRRGLIVAAMHLLQDAGHFDALRKPRPQRPRRSQVAPAEQLTLGGR
jgi:hypothetical protein